MSVGCSRGWCMRVLLKSKVRRRASRGGEGGGGDEAEEAAGSKGEVPSFESGPGETGVTARNAKIQSVEAKLKQRELTI